MNIQLTWQQFDEAVSILSGRLKREEFDGVYGIPRGGLVLAVALSHKLNLPFKDSVTPLTLVVDDISDTGETLLPFLSNIKATIHYVEGSKVEPEVYAYTKRREDWIVYPWEKVE